MTIYGFTEGVAFPDIASYPKNQHVVWCDFQPGQAVIFMGIPNLSRNDVKTVKTGAVKLGVFRQDNVMFLTSKIYQPAKKLKSSLNFECMYHPRIGNDEKYDYSKHIAELIADPQMEMLLGIVVFDTATGITGALRTVYLSNASALGILQIVSSINEKDIGEQEWQATMRKIHQYSPEMTEQFATVRFLEVQPKR
ncbi:hypothetical protein ABD91_21470 [Lysinibacillus sphaericus]|uniref:hypothetical protein n=1 Tax=Lysinibacillus sphaericus TaxID=1421 RepID=UPI0018CFC14B|nr:hypothetical protein [Lysinibacillus sphaericus]MBG9693308.1 hypothetical protein [Lysinibacillus sphaericus]